MPGVSAATGTGKIIAEIISYKKTSIVIKVFDTNQFY